MGEDIGSKLAFVFPGQASQYVGMGSEFLMEYPPAEEMFAAASSILGRDLKEICLKGPEEVLVQTDFTQPAIFVHSCIADRYLSEAGLRPDFAAGHSLGEISALVSSESISFEEGLRIVVERSRAMRDDCDNNPGTMAAVVGMDIDKINEICDSIDGIVQPANFNSPSQIVVSGEVRAVDEFIKKAKDYGAKRVVKIAVGGAYHSPLMSSTPKRLDKVLSEIDFKTLQFPIVANVTGEFYADGHPISDYLIRQIQSPVLWKQSIEYLSAQGVSTFIEVGPGNVLQGLIKRIIKGAKLASFEKPEKLKTIRELFSEKADIKS